MPLRSLLQQDKPDLATGPTLVPPVGKEFLLVAAGTLCDHIDSVPGDSGFFKLQQAAQTKIQLPVAQPGFTGDPRPLVAATPKGVPHRAVDLVLMGADPRADRSLQTACAATEQLLHGL